MERTAKFFMRESGWEAQLHLQGVLVATVTVKDDAADPYTNPILCIARAWIESGIIKSLPHMADKLCMTKSAGLVQRGNDIASARSVGINALH